MKQLILAISFCFLSTFFSANAEQHKQVWIDVRTQAEWNAGHLKNAILIPYDEIVQKIGNHVTNKKQPINLYCRSGRRAEIALRTLEKLGYKNVQNRGGLNDLRQQKIE
ncbi:MAG: rhodanese-like domain-containing protein [Gammaproteobacteria bacterium]|nr:rhodanese-like domain-containing protein [Gammaproteobacteria bacterium]